MTIDELVNKYYKNLNENDLYLWEHISKDRNHFSKMTIEEVSEEVNVSKSSIIRFAQKISLSGYSELKMYLKLNIKQPNISQKDRHFLDILCNQYIESIQELRNRNFDSIFDIILNANRVFLYGSGAVQMNAARELYRMFFNGGDYFYYFDSKTDVNDIMPNLHEGDAMIIISLSGESNQVIELARRMRLKNIKIISLTKNKSNTLASECDANLYFSTVNFGLPGGNGRTFESTTAFFLVCEIFYLKYYEYKMKYIGQGE